MAIEKKFVQEGLKKAMMNECFMKRLARSGYGGMNIIRTPMGTQITIYAEKPGMIIGRSGKTIHKLTEDLNTQFNLDNPQIDVQEVERPELNAQMMATGLANALERGWYFRKAGRATLQRIMNAGALGCEIRISGKLTGPRKRVEKFLAGYIKHAGESVERIVDEGYAIAIKKLGVIGIKVRIVPPGVELPDDFNVIDKERIIEGAPKKIDKDIEEIKEKDAEGVEKPEEIAKVADKPGKESSAVKTADGENKEVKEEPQHKKPNTKPKEKASSAKKSKVKGGN
ncbi:MAG: 30S ribosomal protein S3 [Methanocellales archaeon]|nr:30S ribosomal protein S3 [Methanocellales archaeon]MDD3421093.1 30S ribosomal protein S3 [Methanocellales archaeon]MDD4898202.1 30S ribosomal protein S3 [Methanocellales archaeon]MDD5446693.1 30S ribosomal protein S3 [Methanocellales archaeon]